MSTEMNSLLAGAPHGGASVDRDAIAEIFAEIALEAAIAVMSVYTSDSHARRKADKRPVCDADEYAEAIILERLAERLPSFPVLAEEAAAHGKKTVAGSTFILVDPVDGTREFLNRNGEFTINIGLIVDGAPLAGVVYAPALGQIWIGGATATSCKIAPGATLPPIGERRAIHVRPAPTQGLTALASRSHSDPETEAFLAQLPIKGAARGGIVLEVLRRRRRRRRRLSALWPDDGMGYGRGRRRAAGRGWNRAGSRTASTAIWQGWPPVQERAFRRLGRPQGD
ncbi:putative 3'(2'),5'-bisphosphate nucleotidase [Methylocella tundrae]|uniref:Putative 3'(2'),5'-bisphosphate nucleotidase n=1 Tax=Methylocella tundrae TaxID=227605 RepID=A0A4U8Z4H7_METTU|nr:putative 3'(2'),5'-bisphosphate nucleotidase [Methylocella tundrae]